MTDPLYKKLKSNGTTMYVLPGVSEDKNYESQNDSFKMQISHFALVNFPRQVIGSRLDPEVAFNQNGTSIAPATFKDQLVESLRNYVANHEATVRNSKLNATDFYYDTFEPATVAEKVFWKWCKKLGVIDFEPANPTLEYFGTDPRWNDNGPVGNTDHFREYLWKERDNQTIYDATAVAFSVPGTTVPVLSSAPSGYQYVTVTLTASTTLKPGDFITLTNLNSTTLGNLTNPVTSPASVTSVTLEVAALATSVTLNDQIVILIKSTANIGNFGTVTSIEINNSYQRFLQLVAEISGINNVQLPDRAYTETVAHVSYQNGLTPYALFRTEDDNNYKPNSTWPILPSEIQGEIQGGENPTNPILTDPTTYPGDIWAQFDTSGLTYTTSSGDSIRRSGSYYGNLSANNTAPTLKYPDFDSSGLDGITLDLSINDYAKAVSYAFPVESFGEFCATAFNNVAPKDFQFNAVLWYYTIQDVSGNQVSSATNLYGIEFLDNPDNDFNPAHTLVPESTKLVSNGYQDGNAYTFSLDLNYAIDSDTQPASFDPDKVYSLFGMELFYEAMMRLTYFNDQVTNLITSNITLQAKVDNLTGLVYTQQSLESVRSRMDSLEALLNVYSTLQIGTSDTILPFLDTSVNPPVVRLNSVDKQYGYVYNNSTRDMFTEYVNINGFTSINPIEKTIQVQNGKDFLVVFNNNDYNQPSPAYDPSLIQSNLSTVIEKDLDYKQKMDIIIIPKAENIINGSPINNKKLDIYMNYSDTLTTVKQLIKTVDLPVLQFLSSSTLYDQPYASLNQIPSWRSVSTFYSAPSAAERVFSFLIEDDMLNNSVAAPFIGNSAPVGSQVYIKNMFVENTPSSPSGQFTDMSGQYFVNSTSYEMAPAIRCVITAPGSGYTASSVGYYTYLPSGYPTAYQVLLRVTSGANGKISLMEVVNSVNGLPSLFDYASPINVSSLTYVSGTNLVTSGTGATFNVNSKIRTRIDIKLNFSTDAVLNAFLANYDVLTTASTNLGLFYPIDKFLKISPELTYLRGWKLSIVRISDTATVPVTQLNQRYDINISIYN